MKLITSKRNLKQLLFLKMHSLLQLSNVLTHYSAHLTTNHQRKPTKTKSLAIWIELVAVCLIKLNTLIMSLHLNKLFNEQEHSALILAGKLNCMTLLARK